MSIKGSGKPKRLTNKKALEARSRLAQRSEDKELARRHNMGLEEFDEEAEAEEANLSDIDSDYGAY